MEAPCATSMLEVFSSIKLNIFSSFPCTSRVCFYYIWFAPLAFLELNPFLLSSISFGIDGIFDGLPEPSSPHPNSRLLNPVLACLSSLAFLILSTAVCFAFPPSARLLDFTVLSLLIYRDCCTLISTSISLKRVGYLHTSNLSRS